MKEDKELTGIKWLVARVDGKLMKSQDTSDMRKYCRASGYQVVGTGLSYTDAISLVKKPWTVR